MRLFWVAVMLVLLLLYFYKRRRTIAFINGDVITMTQQKANVIAFKDGKITYVGNEVPRGAKTIDLQGKTLLPGLINSHTHVLFYGLVKHFIDLSGLKKVADIVNKIKSSSIDVAFGYDFTLMDPSEPELDKTILNQIQRPVVVIHSSGHVAYGNDLALKDVDPNTKLIGGSIDFTKGRFYELPGVMTLLRPRVGSMPPNLIRDALQDYLKAGYTTVTEMSLGLELPTALENVKMYSTEAKNVKVVGFVVSQALDQLPGFLKYQNDKFKIGGVKIWADGSIQAGTAGLSPDKLNYSPDDLEKIVTSISKLGLEPAIHANGDLAIEEALSVFEKFNFKRPRIEHCTVLNPDLLSRMKKSKVTPSFTVPHISTWGNVFEKILKEKASQVDMLNSTLGNGLSFSINNDAPLADSSPFELLQTAVTRVTPDGSVLNEKEDISVLEGLKALTLYPAYQIGQNDIGSLAVGNVADFCVVDKNPLYIEKNKISTIEVLEVWTDGKKVLG